MISVCIATHNGERYIKQQLLSILTQIGTKDEIIISDDGSADRTLSIINEINDARIKIFYYSQPTKTKHSHEYVCRNFENALKHANGDYIFLSDQDDEWLPEKVEVCMNSLKNCDLVIHDFILMDENSIDHGQLHYNGSFTRRNYLMKKGKHYGCAMAFCRSILDYSLPFPKHLLLHDYWMGILAETLGRIEFVDKPLIRYRVHDQNTSTTKNSLLFKISYRVLTMLYLIIRVFSWKIGCHHYLKDNSKLLCTRCGRQ